MFLIRIYVVNKKKRGKLANSPRFPKDIYANDHAERNDTFEKLKKIYFQVCLFF